MSRQVVRQAHALDVLVAEVNAAAPHRSKATDGGLGDPAHASRVSDHNPNAAGVWRARDVTNDPAGGMPGHQLSRLVAAKLGKHPALLSGAYVIFNHQIISYDRLAEGWRDYPADNPTAAHEHHVHISVSTAASGYDSLRPWDLFTQEDDMTDDDRKLLRQIAADAAAAKDLARRALARGQVNSRAIVASRANDDAVLALVRRELAALDDADS